MNKTISTKRVLPIDGTFNFRDLGGYSSKLGGVVKWNKAYRSAQLDKLSSRGVSQIADLGVKTLVDLRYEEERQAYPTRLDAFAQAKVVTWQSERNSPQVNIPPDKQQLPNWRDSLQSGDPQAVKEAMRINYPGKLYSHAGIYRRLLMRLMEDRTPLLFHCAAGKDRTGVAAAIILGILGVSNEQIREDYLLTQALIEGHMEAWIATGATGSYNEYQQTIARQSPTVLQPVLTADPAYIDNLLDYVMQNYGGFHHYARQVLNLSEQQIQRLRVSMLA